MTARLDAAAVERAAHGLALRLPRGPHRGRLGEVRANSVGSSLELHDFRPYHPGDDVRHLDWNAVARTGELVLRVRQDEVSPRVEVLLDGSASMAVTEAKAARAREVALWLCTLARHGGQEPTLVALGREVRHAPGAAARALLEAFDFDGAEAFDQALRRAPPPRPCGLRVVVSDFLFEVAPEALVRTLSRGAAGLVLLQVLDADDLDPAGGSGVQLVDAESGESLERVLTPAALARYRERLGQHQRLWEGAARACRAGWLPVSAGEGLEALAREPLAGLGG